MTGRVGTTEKPKHTTQENKMFTQLSPTQYQEAARLFADKFGALAIYNKLNKTVKRSAAANAIGSALHLTLPQLATAAQDEAFRVSVDALIETFELTNPDKVNEEELVMKAIQDIAEVGMRELPHTPDEAADTFRRIQEVKEQAAAAPVAQPVGFSANHMAKDGTPDAKVDAEFEAMMAGFETETAEPVRRFIAGADGTTEDGGK